MIRLFDFKRGEIINFKLESQLRSANFFSTSVYLVHIVQRSTHLWRNSFINLSRRDRWANRFQCLCIASARTPHVQELTYKTTIYYRVKTAINEVFTSDHSQLTKRKLARQTEPWFGIICGLEIWNIKCSNLFWVFRLDEVEDAVNINNKLSQTVKNKDEKISSFETR